MDPLGTAEPAGESAELLFRSLRSVRAARATRPGQGFTVAARRGFKMRFLGDGELSMETSRHARGARSARRQVERRTAARSRA